MAADAASIQALLEAKLGCGRCQVRPFSRARPYSRIYRATCVAHPYPLMVKRCLHPDSGSVDAQSAAVQFRGLQQAWARMDHEARYGVPEPVLLLEHEGIVVAEWIEAPSLTDRLCAWTASSSDVDRLVADAAKWLRWFHGGRQLAQTQIDCELLAQRLTEGDPAVLRDVEFLTGYDLLKQAGSRVRNVLVPCGELHGDFKADNLMVAMQRIVAIDLQPDHCGTVLLDVASFLNHLSLLAWHPKAFRLVWHRRALERRFVEIYLGRYPNGEEWVALLWVRLFNVLGAWLDAAPESLSRLRLRFAHFCYRRVAYVLRRELQAGLGAS